MKLLANPSTPFSAFIRYQFVGITEKGSVVVKLCISNT